MIVGLVARLDAPVCACKKDNDIKINFMFYNDTEKNLLSVECLKCGSSVSTPIKTLHSLIEIGRVTG